ncbi:hypothetical protein HHK36_009376 [Tetracentron sinense]|uniref:Uncharacterized protein n=1 Tax=Tetracentron sinense TaxID=13715 RepID=A0A835DIC6_TETSI|nr:hypothetical protein HHK36_009376 [Tetracentron sinense]
MGLCGRWDCLEEPEKPKGTSLHPRTTRSPSLWQPLHPEPWFGPSHTRYNGGEPSKEHMAFSLGSTPVVVASDPHTAREILTSPNFADRPLKQSAKKLMFSRAIGICAQ